MISAVLHASLIPLLLHVAICRSKLLLMSLFSSSSLAKKSPSNETGKERSCARKDPPGGRRIPQANKQQTRLPKNMMKYIFQKTENCREIMIKHKNMCACFKLFLLVNVFSEILMYFHMLPCNFVFAPHPHVCETYFNIFYVSLHALTCLHMFSTGFKGSMKTAAVFKTLHSPNVGFSSESRDQHFGCEREQLFGKK